MYSIKINDNKNEPLPRLNGDKNKKRLEECHRQDISEKLGLQLITYTAGHSSARKQSRNRWFGDLKCYI